MTEPGPAPLREVFGGAASQRFTLRRGEGESPGYVIMGAFIEHVAGTPSRFKLMAISLHLGGASAIAAVHTGAVVFTCGTQP